MNSLPSPTKYSQIEILRAKIQYWLARADKETNPKKRFEFLVTVQNLSRRLRFKDQGFFDWASVVCAALICVCVGVLIWKYRPKSFIYEWPEYSFRVLSQPDDYTFTLQLVERGMVHPPAVMHFCRDFQPQFEPGVTLTRLAYDDHGSCVSVAPENRGYSLLRDSAACPVVPTNCHHSSPKCDPQTDHILCSGVPKFD